MATQHKKKRPGHLERNKPRHAKFTAAGPGASSKTRSDVPSTPENKAASGKQVRRPSRERPGRRR